MAPFSMENRNFLYKNCPVCGGSSFKPIVVQDGMDVMKCLGCSLVLKNPQPTEKFFLECFDHLEIEKKTICDCILLQEALMAEIKKTDLKDLALLDIDCCDPSSLKALSDLGVEVYSIVRSDELAQDLREETGISTISSGDPATVSRSLRQFDIVLFRFSLERSPDPFEMLMTAQKVLKDNGRIIILTNNFLNSHISRKGWKGFNLPSQLYYFSPLTIRAILRKGRFSFIKTRTLPSCKEKESKVFPIQKALTVMTGLGYFMIATAVKRTINLRLADLQKSQAALFSYNGRSMNKINKECLADLNNSKAATDKYSLEKGT